MIGFAVDLIVDNVIAPQELEERGELRVYRDPEARPIDAHPQEIDLLGVTTRPLEWEIGGGVSLRHEVSVAVVVAHGDPAEGRRLLNGIVTDLVLRTLDAWTTIAQEVGPAGEYPTRLDFAIDWRGLPLDTPNDSATITFVVDVQLDR